MTVSTVKRYGPWKGLNEWPAECGPDQFEDAWNVDFEGDVIRTRKGRVQVISTMNVYPKRVYREIIPVAEIAHPAANSSRSDGTAVLTDGDTTTTFAMGGFGVVGGDAGDIDDLYIGFASPVASVYVTMGTVSTEATTVLTVEVYTSAGWVAIGALSDGTAGFTKSGLITGTVVLTAWKQHTLNGERLYWARVRATIANTSAGTTISGVYSPMTSANTLLSAINGIYSWRRRTGERLTVIGMDLPSVSIARLFVYDWTTWTLRPIAMGSIGSGPGFGAEEQTGPDARWRFDVLDGMLLACNGYLLLHSVPDDPYTMVPFEQAGLVSGSVYQQDVPASAKFIRVFNGRVYIVTREHPDRVRLSEPVGANRDLATGTIAPLGGANIWDKDAWWPLPGDATGLALAGDRLLAFTPTSVTGIVEGAKSVIDTDIGCTAPNTIASARGTVFFLGADGVYATSGGPAKLVSHEVTPTIRGLNSMALPGAVAVVQTSRSRYRLYVPSGNTKQNDLVLLYDYQKGLWTKYGNTPWMLMNPYANDYTVKDVVSASDDEWSEQIFEVDYNGGVWIADKGRTDGSSSTGNIASMVVTNRIKFDDQGLVTLRQVRTEFENGSAGYFYVGALKDGATWKRTTSASWEAYALDIQQAVLNLSDSDVAAAYQVFGGARFPLTGPPVVTGDVWRSKKIVTGLVSMASIAGDVGLTGRYWQIVFHNSKHDQCGVEFSVRGFEADFITRTAKR